MTHDFAHGHSNDAICTSCHAVPENIIPDTHGTEEVLATGLVNLLIMPLADLTHGGLPAATEPHAPPSRI